MTKPSLMISLLFLLLGAGLGLALAHFAPELTYVNWQGGESDLVLIQESLGAELHALEELGVDPATSLEVSRHRALLEAFEAGSGKEWLRGLLLVLGGLAALVLGVGTQIRLMVRRKLYEARAAHTLSSLAWMFLPNALMITTLGAFAGAILALSWPVEVEPSTLLRSLGPEGYGLRIGHYVSAILGLTLFLIPFPQLLRGFADKLQGISGRKMKLLLDVSGALVAMTVFSAFQGDYWLPLAVLLVVAVFLLMIPRNEVTFEKRIALSGLGILGSAWGRDELSDGESALWLGRAMRPVLAGVFAYLLLSGASYEGGEFSGRVVTIVVLASAFVSVLFGPLLMGCGLIWGFFSQGAGLDARVGATLVEGALLPLVGAAFLDSALLVIWVGRCRKKVEVEEA